MKLLEKDRVQLLHLLKDKRELFVVITHKVIASEASVPVDNEIVLLGVKHEIAFIEDALTFLLSISDN